MTGDQLNLPASQVYAAVDMAYNPFTGSLWLAKIGSDNCIMEFDPQSQALTGRTICPPFAHSTRGLAFDPVDGSFYAAPGPTDCSITSTPRG